MRTNAHLQSLTTAFCLAALAAGCGDSPTGTQEEPTTPPTVSIDFGNIEVIEDCDGIEGAGDFAFEVRFGPGSGRVIFNQSISLDDGGRTVDLGHQAHAVEDGGATSATVRFTATEWDKPIIGATYADDRLDHATTSSTHVYSNGTWSNLGTHTMTLGISGCRVRLSYTATG
jgi:hypothetical protein